MTSDKESNNTTSTERRRNTNMNDLTELLMVMAFMAAMGTGWALIYLSTSS